MGSQSIEQILRKKLNNANKRNKANKIPEYIKKYSGNDKRLNSLRIRKGKA